MLVKAHEYVLRTDSATGSTRRIHISLCIISSPFTHSLPQMSLMLLCISSAACKLIVPPPQFTHTPHTHTHTLSLSLSLALSLSPSQMGERHSSPSDFLELAQEKHMAPGVAREAVEVDEELRGVARAMHVCSLVILHVRKLRMGFSNCVSYT